MILKKVDGLGDIIAFSAMLTIAEKQSPLNGGINFELSLQYEGAGNSIEIHNPLYSLQYILTGSDKTQQLKGGKPPIPLINRQGPISANTDFNFNILGIKKMEKPCLFMSRLPRPLLLSRMATSKAISWESPNI
ncbi:MAG: hypothetical protein H0X43_07520 [Nitrosospira sp.]|nr:hypothetical protein [Nitrosospira sp.]